MASNWSGNISFGESQYFEPRSIDELQELVSTNQKIRVRGSAHSFNSIADTNSIAINLAHLPKTLKIDRDRKVVEVSASLKYGEFIPALHQQMGALKSSVTSTYICRWFGSYSNSWFWNRKSELGISRECNSLY